MLKLLGIQASPAIVALIGLAVAGLGVTRGGPLLIVVGATIVGLAVLRAVSAWRG